MFMPDQRIARS